MAKTPTPRGKTPQTKSTISTKSTNKKPKATPKSSSTQKSSGKKSEIAAVASPPITREEGIIYRKSQLECYSFIDLRPRTDAFLDPPTEFHDNWRIQVGDFVCIQVNSNIYSGSCPPGKARKSPPFNILWRPCQVLSIFRERPSKLKTAWDPLKVEVRWFYRQSDLDKRNRDLEKVKRTSKEEVFESDHVAILDANLLLGRLELFGANGANLGVIDETRETCAKITCCRFYLHNEQDMLYLFDKENVVTRGLEYSDRLQKHGELRKQTYKYLQLAAPEKENSHGASKDQNMLSLPPHSLHVNYSDGSKTFYPSCHLTYPWSMLDHRSLVCPLEQRGSFPKWQLCVGDVVAVPCESSQPPMGVDLISGRSEWYPYSQPWSHAQVIAIYRNDVNKSNLTNEEELTHMFASEVRLRIRWFNRISEAISVANASNKLTKLEKLQKMVVDPSRTAETIFEGKELTEINCDLLLGPVCICDKHTQSPSKKGHAPSVEDDSPVSMYMVQNRRELEGSVANYESLLRRGLKVCDRDFSLSDYQKDTYLQSIVAVRKRRIEEMKCSHSSAGISEVKERDLPSNTSTTESRKKNKIVHSIEPRETGTATNSSKGSQEMDGSEIKSLPKKRRLFDEKYSVNRKSPHQSHKKSRIDKEVVGIDAQKNGTAHEDNPPVDDVIPRVFCRKQPFHVDVSSMKSFYDEIEISPPLDSYDDIFLSKIKSSQRKRHLKVKMGDTVTLEIEPDSKAVPASHYPFNVAWSPVEIVSIYRVHKTKDSCLKLRQSIQVDTADYLSVSDINIGDDDVRLEVRWLYRLNEIPGAKKTTSPSRSSAFVEEVFETDHLDTCTADSILSPVMIHETTQPPADELKDTIDGLPCIHYYCSRFWSLHRKSFIPSGSFRSRVQRGRMYSGFFGKHGTAKAALSRLEDCTADENESTPDLRDSPWQEAFHEVIKTLSLAEAAQDVQLRGTRLACRDDERKKISDFLRTAICGRARNSQDQDTGNMAIKTSMFIGGPPGTGKTASVRSVIRELQEDQSSGQVPEFKYIELNGLEMQSPYDAYVKFWEGISGIKKEMLPPGQAAARLDNYFCEEAEVYGDCEDEIERKPLTVLLLDEVDYLVTEKETVLYSFFDWPLRALPGAKLIVIGIANTINLPDRLSPKLSSRMGSNRMFFGAYNHSEITTIIKKRLGMKGDIHDPTRDVFEVDAIRFAAKKTANRSGDIRKAFQICKVAAERVYEASVNGTRKSDNEARPIVRTDDVSKASRDMFHSTFLKAISCSTNYQACLLVAIGALMNMGREDGAFDVQDIRAKMNSIADATGDRRYSGVNLLAWSDVLYMVTRLAESGILQFTYPRLTDPFPLVRTSLSPYEISAAFKHTSHAAIANKYLSDNLEF